MRWKKGFSDLSAKKCNYSFELIEKQIRISTFSQVKLHGIKKKWEKICHTFRERIHNGDL